MGKPQHVVYGIAGAANAIAAAAVAGMMVLTCADVFLRFFFRHPIQGTYDIVGFLGTVVVSFSLASTTILKGHISVDFFTSRLSRTSQRIIDVFIDAVSLGIFALIAWRSAVYAIRLKEAGEVSLTIQFPLYPVAFGIALGCALTAIVLAISLVHGLKRLGGRP